MMFMRIFRDFNAIHRKPSRIGNRIRAASPGRAPAAVRRGSRACSLEASGNSTAEAARGAKGQVARFCQPGLVAPKLHLRRKASCEVLSTGLGRAEAARGAKGRREVGRLGDRNGSFVGFRRHRRRKEPRTCRADAPPPHRRAAGRPGAGRSGGRRTHRHGLRPGERVPTPAHVWNLLDTIPTAALAVRGLLRSRFRKRSKAHGYRTPSPDSTAA